MYEEADAEKGKKRGRVDGDDGGDGQETGRAEWRNPVQGDNARQPLWATDAPGLNEDEANFAGFRMAKKKSGGLGLDARRGVRIDMGFDEAANMENPLMSMDGSPRVLDAPPNY